MKCTRCGGKDLVVRGIYLGCLDCGLWCYAHIKGLWVML